MARLVAAFGASHSLMLTAQLEDWCGNFHSRDRAMRHVDADGNWCSYDDLLTKAPPDATDRIRRDLLEQRFADVNAAIARLTQDIQAAKLDAIVVLGDDQKELFQDWNMPAIGVYYGDTIRNAKRDTAEPKDWAARARLRRYEDHEDANYPCNADLALHLIEMLQREQFDLSAMKRLAEGQSEGHAYSFVHRFFMRENVVPIVPVFLNAYYPPNQPTPARCLALGAAIARAVASFPDEIRVGLLASGGLSHFVVDEQFDRAFIDALRRHDAAWMRSIPLHKLMSGSSEMRNWICMAGGLGDLSLDWVSYNPGYRTEALTGTGLCFASWH
ncbi:MAG: hypothetical protein JOY70_10530 [Acidisphaera sp.]|nr:hypothetical protein [Acidisphaera sp.]